jgi:Flp pilus assembly protein TadD
MAPCWSLVLSLSLALFSGATAHAQDIWATPDAPAEPKPEPVPAPAAPVMPAAAEPPRYETVALEAQTYEARVLLGLRQIVMRDFAGAVETLRKAARMEPKSPAAFCHMGDAQLEQGVFAEATAAYESCARFAGLEDPRYAALANVGLARTVEKKSSDLAEEREAWVRARDAIAEPAAKAMAEARIAVYDGALAREKSHEAVRRRIVEREVAQEAAGMGN